MDTTLPYWSFLWWAAMCILIGRSVGKTIDTQYREPAGNPSFVTIPDRWKWLFHFRYTFGNEVVREGFLTHILGYCFAAIELLFLLCATVFKQSSLAQVSNWTFILFGSAVVLALIPMYIRYQRNLQQAYDCDWITQIQGALTIFPRRRCRILSQINSTTCWITLGRFGRRKYMAKMKDPVTVGKKMYAIHSTEGDAPFWTVKEH